ncbi:hypothetical protein FRC12_004854 [Ceratobasidium sp. 428]|nr:hypothetical protein FRC12_004854 [Ceratobasidium sp. 428]
MTLQLSVIDKILGSAPSSPAPLPKLVNETFTTSVKSTNSTRERLESYEPFDQGDRNESMEPDTDAKGKTRGNLIIWKMGREILTGMGGIVIQEPFDESGEDEECGSRGNASAEGSSGKGTARDGQLEAEVEAKELSRSSVSETRPTNHRKSKHPLKAKSQSNAAKRTVANCGISVGVLDHVASKDVVGPVLVSINPPPRPTFSPPESPAVSSFGQIKLNACTAC